MLFHSTEWEPMLKGTINLSNEWNKNNITRTENTKGLWTNMKNKKTSNNFMYFSFSFVIIDWHTLPRKLFGKMENCLQCPVQKHVTGRIQHKYIFSFFTLFYIYLFLLLIIYCTYHLTKEWAELHFRIV